LIDVDTTMQNIARLAATFFADWCILFVADQNGSLRQLSPEHADPSKVAWMQHWLERYPLGRNEAYGPLHVWRTGRSELVEEIPDWFLADLAEDETHLEMMRELSPHSYMCVLMAAHGAPAGVMLFVAAESGRRYDAADLSAAEDLARRAAVAIDNARLYEELRDADRRKADFLAVLAHELRNSIAPIKYGIELQRVQPLEPSAWARARDAVDRQLEQMTRLVDDLLDISRISRGKLTITRDLIDLRATLAEAVEASRPLIDTRQHLLSVSVPDEELPVRGDSSKLRQIFVNLLNNAAKYSPPGGPIWLSGKRIEKTIEVRVRDRGIGIAHEQLPHVFDLFAQAPQGARQAMGGLGIGLSLVRDLTELHGGTAEARSDGLGTGSEFIVRLPASAETPSAAAARQC
jgi:signal transduction histidine kinase